MRKEDRSGSGGESRVHTERFHLSFSGRLVCLELTGFILHPLGCLRAVNEEQYGGGRSKPNPFGKREKRDFSLPLCIARRLLHGATKTHFCTTVECDERD